jgi:hypothetical protein
MPDQVRHFRIFGRRPERREFVVIRWHLLSSGRPRPLSDGSRLKAGMTACGDARSNPHIVAPDLIRGLSRQIDKTKPIRRWPKKNKKGTWEVCAAVQGGVSNEKM